MIDHDDLVCHRHSSGIQSPCPNPCEGRPSYPESLPANRMPRSACCPIVDTNVVAFAP